MLKITGKERTPDFKDFIKSGKKLSVELPVEEVVHIISKFHHTTPKYVLHAFRDLEKAEHHMGYTAVFGKPENADATYLKVECFDNEGKSVSVSLIDSHSGQPIHKHN